MGNFQAFTIGTDEPVEFTGDAINIGSSETTTPSRENYYKSILKAALTTFQLESKLTPKKEQNATDFEKEMEDLWQPNDRSLIGYILQDTHLSKDIDTILNRIADEENKYYWKWLESGNEVKEASDIEASDISETVLNQLRIVNTRLLNRIFINTPGEKVGKKQWKENEIPLQDEELIAPAIAISPEGSYRDNNESYYGVYINTKARLLFLDNSENTQKYKYGIKTGTSYYEKKRTYKYDKKTTEGKHSTLIEDDKSSAEYFWGEEDKGYRYLLKLKTRINQLVSQFPNGVLTKIVGSVFKPVNNSEQKLLYKSNFGKLTSEKQTAIKEIAETGANQLPKGNYHCFYHDKQGTLTGHISAVHIGEGGRGGSGYPMRADKVNEVNYQWFINLPIGDDNIPLAKLWSYLFELDRELLAKIRPSIENNLYPTNWPYDKGSGFRKTVTGMESWIEYYKTFDKKATRRNKPSINPFPPRITNPSIINYGNYKFDIKTIEKSVKLDNTSYRVWKKINSSGDELTLGSNNNDREDAGKTMAEALRDFYVYAKMKGSEITPKITDSKLSATAFAKYVVGELNDDAVKKQWRSDNNLHTNDEINVSSLRTDQEWCHLFGHGDGGTEELGNFVCGSKHCNTEQLAIETGQRRVSQNEDFTQEERNKLKAKITAYLIPNSGTWVSGKTYKEEYVNKTLLQSITLDNVKRIMFNFFEVVPSTNPVEYRLKTKAGSRDSSIDDKALRDIDDEALRKAFKELSNQITNASSHAEKKELFQFRHNLEKHFFMYLPIARWMRYKIYYDGTKVFDHIYDAQSESMNLHECQILDYTVERELYKAMKKWTKYKEKIKSRVENLVPTAEEAKITSDVLALDDSIYAILNEVERIQTMEATMRIIKIMEEVLKTESKETETINISTLQQDYEELEQSLTYVSSELVKQTNFCKEILENFEQNLTDEQKYKSRLTPIIKDKEFNERIGILKMRAEEMDRNILIIKESIEKIQLSVNQPNSDEDSIKSNAVNAQIVVNTLSKLGNNKRNHEEMKETDLPSTDPQILVRPLKRLASNALQKANSQYINFVNVNIN